MGFSRFDVGEEFSGGASDFGYGRVKGVTVRLRGSAEAAHFTNELESCGGNFVRSGGRFGTSEDFDAPAHPKDYYATVAEHLHLPDKAPEFAVALTHGAGAGCETPLLTAVAEALCDAGAVVLRYDLPFRLKKRPPLPATAGEDRAGIREAADRVRGMTGGPVVIAGHSYGGRQGSMLAAEDPTVGAALLLLSYPLHPPGKPDKMRTEHFPSLKVPALFVSGERDEFGTQDEMKAALKLIPSKTRLIEVPKAGHDLKRGKFDLDEMVTAVREMLGL